MRDHDRRKPKQQEKTHVDRYTREQEIHGGPPPRRDELGPRDIDEETAQIVAIEKELHPTVEFLRMGETENFENELLGKFRDKDGELNEGYGSFDEVPQEILDKIKCPHCSHRQFSLWGEPEAYGMGSIDFDKAHIEEDDHDYMMDMASQGGSPTKLVCDNCSSEFGCLEF